jgi:parallel beta-helix repeat protein
MNWIFLWFELDIFVVMKLMAEDPPDVMTKISGDYTTGATFKYSTTHPVPGAYTRRAYTYAFFFNDGHGHDVWLPPNGAWFYFGPNVTEQQQNQLPTCAVELRKQGTTTINEIGIREFFDIYVGGSMDDTGIKEVCFLSDESQNGGVDEGFSWTKWFDWDTSEDDWTGYWDAENKIKTWSFATPGEKEVWIEVKDDVGQSAKCSVNIYAIGPPPTDTIPPDTEITGGPSGTIDYNDVTFMWTGLDDATLTSELVYSYYLEGYDDARSEWTSDTSKQYTDLPTGYYIFKIKAKDQAGNIDPSPAERPFAIPQNPPPLAYFSYSPTEPKAGEWITFNALDSYDPDGEIKLYGWDLNNDGIYEECTPWPKIKCHWNKAGTYQVGLKVIDNNGASGVLTKAITVKTSFWDKVGDFFKDIWPWGEKVKKIEDSDLSIIEEKLGIDKWLPTTRFYWCTDHDLKVVLNQEIYPEEVPGLTYGIYILNAIRETEMVKDVLSQEYKPQYKMYFSNWLDLNTGWSAVAKGVSEEALDRVIEKTCPIGGTMLSLARDSAEVGEVLVPLRDLYLYNTLWSYFDNRRYDMSHHDAWINAGSDPVAEKNYFANLPCGPEVEKRFNELWETYEEFLSDRPPYLKEEDIRKELRSVLLSALEKYNKLPERYIVIIQSPIELRVYDPQGSVVGFVEGEVREEILYSAYDIETGMAVIFYPSHSYCYEVVGTEEGTYGLDITSVENGEVTTFAVTDVSITNKTTHQYTINWSALSQGEKGVTVQMDSDSDGVFEQNITIQPPLASFTYTPEKPTVNQTITFNASNSTDPDENITRYEWNFGDGASESGEVVIHSFSSAGTYVVTLTIVDNDGAMNSVSEKVSVTTTTFITVGPSGCDYTKIQEAIDFANLGDTIIVTDGTYIENINVDKRLTIKSENGSENCIIHAADPRNSIFMLTANYINLSGFTVEGTTAAYTTGIHLRNANHCYITNNIASKNRNGIFLDSSTKNTIEYNNASNNVNSHGISLYSSNNNEICNNIANSNHYQGIGLWTSSGNIIANNTCSNNKNGIFLQNSRYNSISNNTCSSNKNADLYPNNEAAGITLQNSRYNSISNNTCSYNDAGITLRDSNRNSISNNTCSYSEYARYRLIYRQINKEAAGITLWNSRYNSISNNTCLYNKEASITLRGSNHNSISNNICSYNSNGISIGNSEYIPPRGSPSVGSNQNSISNNICSYNSKGISLVDDSKYNTVSNNICSNNYEGISLSASNNTISNNTCSYNSNGLTLSWYSTNNSISNNTCSYNMYYGIPLYYGSNNCNIINNTCSYNVYDGILLEDSNHNNISNNNCSYNRIGISLWNSEYDPIVGSNHNNICNNTCSHNDIGIYLRVSNCCSISKNHCSSNDDYGIFLDWSDKNFIYLNNFINNANNADCYGTSNIWNSIEKINYIYTGTTYTNYLGNYWSDYAGSDANNDGIGDTSYSINSDKDNYPLMETFENYI